MYGYFLKNLTTQMYDPWGQLQLTDLSTGAEIDYTITQGQNVSQKRVNISESSYTAATGEYQFTTAAIGAQNFDVSQIVINELIISNLVSGSATTPLNFRRVLISQSNGQVTDVTSKIVSLTIDLDSQIELDTANIRIPNTLESLTIKRDIVDYEIQSFGLDFTDMENDKSITSIEIPDELVKHITPSDYLFYNAKSFNVIQFVLNMPSYSKYCFSGAQLVADQVTIPSQITIIPDYCFFGLQTDTQSIAISNQISLL